LRPKGNWGRFGQVFGGFDVVNAAESCSDQTGFGDCDPLSIEKVSVEGGLINRGVVGDYWNAWFTDYAADVFDNFDNFPHHTSLPGNLTNEAAATAGAARSNPSRPYVDLPVALFELRELPDLIKSAGSGILRRWGSDNLKLQFGINPLIGDLVKLAQFEDAMDRRVKQLEAFRVLRSYRKTMTVGTFSDSGVYGKALQSQGWFAWGDFHANTKQEVRVHCRWSPTMDLSWLAQPTAMRELARRAVLGLTVDSLTAWNALPWSWLTDWASNAQEFFTATRNLVPAALTGVHVMRHTKTVYEYGGYASSDGWEKIQPAKITRESKTRTPSFVAPVAHFPFLDGRQVGILGSLAVTRL